MIIDGHAHVILPVEQQLALMEKAGVERTVLFMTSVHPERASDLTAFEKEMATLTAIISGQRNGSQATFERSAQEHIKIVQAYPARFIGFGGVPVGLTHQATAECLQKYVLEPGMRGIGEFTLAPGQIDLLEPIFALSSETGNLPLWVHTFIPLTLEDIRALIRLSQRYASVPLILGHLGGLNWIETIKLAKELPQTYLDLSATYTTLAPTLAIRELPERSLFSSDAPYGNPLVARTMVEQATTDPGIRKLVLGENMARLVTR
ncbi:amidohydrolase [Ktedonosporobacter rubrisoli]|uniref:Amidohydrolase n=1 Tax=Ktedonosporobacter rubrisoli TaxID=2509675 RepID=A0A4P6JN03_KTERU|nr:amidohydrolase family protein [Ktedonosporobacter rubrisoli]QBD76450.1 amidohydrolase [Ktedonosporobacter rubrisoli]